MHLELNRCKWLSYDIMCLNARMNSWPYFYTNWVCMNDYNMVATRKLVPQLCMSLTTSWCNGYYVFLHEATVYPKKYAHGFVVLCFIVVMQSFIMNSHEVFIHIHQGCFAGTGAIVRLPQCQWSKPDGYGKISQCITTTKHSKAKTVCIFLGIYCNATSQWHRCCEKLWAPVPTLWKRIILLA